MEDSDFKQLFAFAMLIITVGWAAFCVIITKNAIVTKDSIDILTAAGVNVLLGSLITWTGNIVQFFFRKAQSSTTPEVPDSSRKFPKVPGSTTAK